MTGADLRASRERAGWTQAELAVRLGVTQAYVSLLESGGRPVPPRLARRLATLLALPPEALPFAPSTPTGLRPTNEWLTAQLARLGYPGYAYRTRRHPARNPVEVLLAALTRDDLDPRLAEALPWLLLRHEGLDTDRLVAEAKARDVQNRLGFVVALARQVAEGGKEFAARAPSLRRLESSLERSRLAREDVFAQGRASARLRQWLRRNRSRTARHWNLLTDLKAEHLPYAA
jgi:transcriptional regulator with XRE-family HTH domain